MTAQVQALGSHGRCHGNFREQDYRMWYPVATKTCQNTNDLFPVLKLYSKYIMLLQCAPGGKTKETLARFYHVWRDLYRGILVQILVRNGAERWSVGGGRGVQWKTDAI